MCLKQEQQEHKTKFKNTNPEIKKKKKKNSFIFQVPTQVEKFEDMDVRAFALPFSPNIADTLSDVNIFTATSDFVFFKDLWDQNQVCVFIISLPFFVPFLGFISQDWSFIFLLSGNRCCCTFEALWMSLQVITNQCPHLVVGNAFFWVIQVTNLICLTIQLVSQSYKHFEFLASRASKARFSSYKPSLRGSVLLFLDFHHGIQRG